VAGDSRRVSNEMLHFYCDHGGPCLVLALDLRDARAEVEQLRKDFGGAMELLHQANAIIMSHKDVP
jgi:hypothetical protein